MAVLTKDELLGKIKTRLDGDTSDEALALIEDLSDTIGELETRSKDTTEWKQKYEENDKAWRDKYKARFFNPQEKSEPDEMDKDDTEKPKTLTFEELFKEE